MRCPVCGDTELELVQRHGVGVPCCPGCGGVWLDPGNFGRLVERIADAARSAIVSRMQARREYLFAADSRRGSEERGRSFLNRLFDSD